MKMNDISLHITGDYKHNAECKKSDTSTSFKIPLTVQKQVKQSHGNEDKIVVTALCG